jgi:hypothetical protein
MITKAHCFTVNANGRLHTLSTEALVRSSVNSEKSATHQAKAIWDTGATGSVITQQIAATCGLKPIGMTKTSTANGERDSEVFLIDVMLPNNVVFNQLRVTCGDLGAKGPDMLIGMDIIGHGDFAVTCHGGKTTFSFRLPSMDRIDFLKAEKKHVGRNDPCPCGSGKKLKSCCNLKQSNL